MLGEPYDCNTLPSPSNSNRTELYIKAMKFSNNLEEIMNGDSQSVLTDWNDGSSLDHAGDSVVQSFNINGVQRILRTFGILTETKKYLAKLIQTTPEILAAATGWQKWTLK